LQEKEKDREERRRTRAPQSTNILPTETKPDPYTIKAKRSARHTSQSTSATNEASVVGEQPMVDGTIATGDDKFMRSGPNQHMVIGGSGPVVMSESMDARLRVIEDYLSRLPGMDENILKMVQSLSEGGVVSTRLVVLFYLFCLCQFLYFFVFYFVFWFSLSRLCYGQSFQVIPSFTNEQIPKLTAPALAPDGTPIACESPNTLCYLGPFNFQFSIFNCTIGGPKIFIRLFIAFFEMNCFFCPNQRRHP
jgi:hypothetical protein